MDTNEEMNVTSMLTCLKPLNVITKIKYVTSFFGKMNKSKIVKLSD